MLPAPADGLYTISDPTTVDGAIEATVRLDAAHPVFAGHFPGRPILPGVIAVRIALAIAQRSLGKGVALRNARSIKFLAPVDPRATPELRYRLRIERSDDGMRMNVESTAAEVIVFKMTAGIDVVA